MKPAEKHIFPQKPSGKALFYQMGLLLIAQKFWTIFCILLDGRIVVILVFCPLWAGCNLHFSSLSSPVCYIIRSVEIDGLSKNTRLRWSRFISRMSWQLLGVNIIYIVFLTNSGTVSDSRLEIDEPSLMVFTQAFARLVDSLGKLFGLLVQ